jgi:hypothetical protein
MSETYEVAVFYQCSHMALQRARDENEAMEFRRMASQILCSACEILRLEDEKRKHHKHHRHHHHEHRTTSIAIQFGENNAMNSLSLTVGQESTGTIVPLEVDGVTQTPGAVVSAQEYVISDPSLEATTNADGSVTILGIAAGTTVTGTASATVTDADGAVAQFTQTFTVTVSAAPPPPPTGLTTSIGVSFTAPVTAPAAS